MAAPAGAPTQEALEKSVKDFANGAYFDGLVGWFEQQIAQSPPNAPLGQMPTALLADGSLAKLAQRWLDDGTDGSCSALWPCLLGPLLAKSHKYVEDSLGSIADNIHNAT